MFIGVIVGTNVLLISANVDFFPNSVTDSFFNTSRPTKFIIHGFGSSCYRVWPKEMTLSFLAVVS